jgi:RNA polymerase sigma-70 factor (ECF subfamily)
MTAGDTAPTANPDDDDIALMTAMANGDRAALAALYDRHAPTLLALGLRIVKHRGEAEDLLHDVFLEAWRNAKSYDLNRGRVRTWLVIRMRSRALDVLKSARVSRRTDDERVAERVVGDDDPSASPDQRRVRAALSEIPPSSAPSSSWPTSRACRARTSRPGSRSRSAPSSRAWLPR